MAHAANTTNDPRLPVLPPAVGAKLSPATYTPMHGCVLQAMPSNTVRYLSSPLPSGTAAGIVTVDAKLSSTVITYGCISIETRRFATEKSRFAHGSRTCAAFHFFLWLNSGKFITFGSETIHTNVVETIVRRHLVYIRNGNMVNHGIRVTPYMELSRSPQVTHTAELADAEFCWRVTTANAK